MIENLIYAPIGLVIMAAIVFIFCGSICLIPACIIVREMIEDRDFRIAGLILLAPGLIIMSMFFTSAYYMIIAAITIIKI